MNNDPRDDENEIVIKSIFGIFIFFAFILFLCIITIGCTRNVDKFHCKCDCSGKSILECSAEEHDVTVKGR